jgi:multicomponent Na+:H+ antiporter subunit A
MAGLPPLFGFVAKELLYEAKTQTPRAALLVTGAGLVANVLMVATAGLVGLAPFLGRRGATPKPPHEGPPALWAGPLLLALAGLVFGVLPERTVGPLVEAAVAAVRAERTQVTLKLWHGLNPILLLSVVTVLTGVAVFRGRAALVAAAAPARRLAGLGPARLYERGLAGFVAFCRGVTGVVQTGRLSHDLRIVIVTLVALVAAALALRGGLALPVGAWPQPLEAALVVLLLAGAVAVARARSRLVAVLALGLVGFGVALVFLIWSGPDLALTQFAIETLSVLLFAFVIGRLPRLVEPGGRLARAADLVVAGAAGAAVTALALSVVARPKLAPLAEFFAAASLPEGRGRNVVNVILVDFRAFDTLGEITVLAVAALGVLALLKLRPGREARP